MREVSTTREPARLLDVAAVADLLGVSTRHVYRMADGGRMPRPVKLGGANRWDRIAIENWIADGCRPVDPKRKGVRR